MFASQEKMRQSISTRWCRVLFIGFFVLLVTIALYGHHSRNWGDQILEQIRPANRPTTTSITDPSPEHLSLATPTPRPGITFKNATSRPLAARPFVAIEDPLPLLTNDFRSLPPVPEWNKPPSRHVPEVTPLFIGFTRNYPLLLQTIISFITAGWPPSDIYVVENTGLMDFNLKSKLTLQNPFYLNHKALSVLGVNVITTPSLQSFAQLQTLFLYESIRNKWPHYFWAHMDILVQSHEAVSASEYKSFYLKCVDAIRDSNAAAKKGRKWALRYFAYDWVTLMNVEAMVELGGWDTMVGWYSTDCDMYDRMRMYGYSTEPYDSGPVYDTGSLLPDLLELYRVDDQGNSTEWHELQKTGKEMTRAKNQDGDRNRWQIQQMGGQDEPWYRDMDGFVEALEHNIKAGVKVFAKKWGGGSCSLRNDGLREGDEWVVESIDVEVLKLSKEKDDGD